MTEYNRSNRVKMVSLVLCTLLAAVVAKKNVKNSVQAAQNSCSVDCFDVEVQRGFDCQQQASWGKCDEPWMSVCRCSCNLCQEDSVPSSASAIIEPQYSTEGLIPWGDFVQRSGTRFIKKSRTNPEECENFYFLGYNTFYPMIKAAEASTRPEIIEILDDAAAMGLTVMRMWGFSDGPMQWHSQQRYPGRYDEATLVGLDFTLHEASKRGIRLLIAFANYWQHYGGVDQYNIWSYQAGYGSCNGEYSCRDEFFTDPLATQFYKDHIYNLLNRRNTFNGRLYKEDPAIFGFNLLNEPRSKADLYVVTRVSTDVAKVKYNITYNNGETLQTWIEDIAKYVKSIDPVHLLTTGQEGFFGESSPLYLYANPGAWAALEGNDFVRNHKVEDIDFATMHAYVDQWLCDLRGSTREGQMKFFKEWVEAHQEAAEEELQMPVILEEFGGKLEDNKRYDLFKFAFDSQIKSVERGGSFGGVMFWVLLHSDYEPIDKYGGDYGVVYPASSKAMQDVQDLIVGHANRLSQLNSNSSSIGTCVWYPQWPQGLGCRHIEIDFELGGMPWSCLPGEPENINWCNAKGRDDLYENPPIEWRGRKNGADLPFNTIEALIMGKIINRAKHTVNLRGSYITIPFSRGIHTQYEGVWDRVENPNEEFLIHCWYVTKYEWDGITLKGTSLCSESNTAIKLEFTQISWPQGSKRDRGLRITFVEDILLSPGGYLAGSKDGSATMFSFKGALLHYRLDVSSLTLAGATECPDVPRLKSWPPPPPPPPPPCSQGKHPHRGCPNLEWYVPGEAIKYLPVDPIPDPCQFDDCPMHTYNPSGPQQTSQEVGTQSSFSGMEPPLIDEAIMKLKALMSPEPCIDEKCSLNASDIQIFPALKYDTPVEDVASPQNEEPESILTKITIQLAKERKTTVTGSSNRRLLNTLSTPQSEENNATDIQQGRMNFTLGDFTSISNEYNATGLGLRRGEPLVFIVDVSAVGNYRRSEQQVQRVSRDDKEIDLNAAAAGLLVREEEPESVTADEIGPTAQDTPNPEARGAASRGGLPVMLIAEMRLRGVAGKKYRKIAKGVVIPNGEKEILRGVIEFDESVTAVKVYAEVPVSGLSVMLGYPQIVSPVLIDEDEADAYNPCILDPDRSPDAVMVFVAEGTEEWKVEVCSQGYGQTLRVYEDGEEVALLGHGYGTWSIPDFEVQKGSKYHFVLDGDDRGLPYSSWRGGSGIRIIRKNGEPFNGFFDAKRTDDPDFVYAKDGKFWQGCQQYSFVGVNTWDLMDIARYEWRRHEVDERLDELNKAGLTVGRTWGFSLGTGTTPEERENRLQLTPGVYDESVFVGLDYALYSAAQHGIRLIISIEDFWLSVGAYEDWSDTMQSKTDFYTDWKARNYYKDHVKKIVHRVNTFTNVTYLDDPTILAWNLMNEPRCTGCAWALQAWIDEMSTHVKALDANHMVTVGEEGFYSSTCHRVHANPGAGSRRSGLGSSPWALQEGQDFIKNHRPDAIDFATVHVWMDNWMGYADYCGFKDQNRRFDYTYGCDLWREKLDATVAWLTAHIEDVKKLDKPLVVQEFGKTIDATKLHREIAHALMPGEKAHQNLFVRDKFFKAIYDLIEEDALNDGNTLGSNFWNLYKEGHGNDDPYHVTLSHTSTMSIVANHAYNMKQLHNSTSTC